VGSDGLLPLDEPFANLAGDVDLAVGDEIYGLSLPGAYAQSILSSPFLEFGGKVAISCEKSGYSATVMFYTKPFYGGKLHKCSAEIFDRDGKAIGFRAQGEWNDCLEFTNLAVESAAAAKSAAVESVESVDVKNVEKGIRRLRPIESQHPRESRRLWKNVTDSLRRRDFEKATEEKNSLEEQQRVMLAKGALDEKRDFFVQTDNRWCFKGCDQS